MNNLTSNIQCCFLKGEARVREISRQVSQESHWLGGSSKFLFQASMESSKRCFVIFEAFSHQDVDVFLTQDLREVMASDTALLIKKDGSYRYVIRLLLASLKEGLVFVGEKRSGNDQKGQA
jgi:hypothetical protein